MPIVVDVASKSPSSTAPGRKSMPWFAIVRRYDAIRCPRNSSRTAAQRARSGRPSSAATNAASLSPRSTKASSQYECIGLAEYPSWLIDWGTRP